MDKLFEMNENNSVVIKYNGNEREVVIPASVCEIGERAFEDNEFIESITFEGDKIICRDTNYEERTFFHRKMIIEPPALKK